MNGRLPLAIALCLTPWVAGACSDAPDPLTPPDVAASLSNAPAELGSTVFDLAANPDGSLLAGEIFTGNVVELRKGATHLAGEGLFGVTGLAPIGRGNTLVLTGAGFGLPADGESKLFRMSRGGERVVADLGAFEETVNPDQVWNSLPPESNPYNVVGLGGGAALVADAAGNSVVHVSADGAMDWVAVLTPQDAETQYLKDFVGCPESAAPFCDLPPALPAQPVPTGLALGPDGYAYVGELTGFPGTPGISRVWRVDPDRRQVICPGDGCTQVVGGLTSVVDMEFGPDGLLYVTELDALGWFAIEIAGGSVAGGRVKACDVDTGACSVVVTGLSLPLALAFDANGAVWVAEHEFLGGPASIGSLF